MLETVGNKLKTEEKLNRFCQNSLVGFLGIEITDMGEHFVNGKMPVDERTKQPFGCLHGGASLSLAETLASIGAMQAVDSENLFCVGLEINANHIKTVHEGYVYGKAEAVHLGKKTQVWSVRIVNDSDQLVCISRLTLAVLDKKQ